MKRGKTLQREDYPHDEELEAGTLGAIMQRGPEIMDECPIPLAVDHYFIPRNQTIFSTLRRLIGEQKPVDLISLTNRLREDETLAMVGGASYVTECFTRNVGFSNEMYSHYVICLEDLSKRRKTRELGEWAIEAAKDTTSWDDPQEVISEIERRAFAIGETRIIGSSTELALKELLEQIKVRRLAGKKFEGGIKTGLPPFDKVFGGIMPERMYVIAARPGDGKTAAVEQAITSMLQQGYPALVFEKDMPRSRLLGRMACRMARQSFYYFERGWLTEDQLDLIEVQARDLAGAPFYIYDPSRLTAEDVYSIVRREKRKNGIAAWYLDHVQLLDYAGDDIRVGLTRASLTLKRCVNVTKVSGIIVAQLNRRAGDSKQGKPNASQIKEFDQLNADAGCIVVIYSEKEDRKDLEKGEPLLMQWNIDKNNFGVTSDESCWFNRELMQFYEVDAPNI